MKRIFLMASLIIASFGVMNAQAQMAPQPANTHSELPQVKAKKLVSKINTVCMLQGDQFGKVNNICVDYYTKLDALQKATPGISETDAKVTALKATRDEALKGALTAEQNKQWATYTAQQKTND